MKHGIAVSLVPLMVAGCVHPRAQLPVQVMPIAVGAAVAGAHPAPWLVNVPDIPSVGAQLDEPTIAQALAGYGDWIADDTYGSIWVPSDPNASGFVPYGTDGQWIATDVGWYWQSALVWGWVTFHYGRWIQLGNRWAWVPGGVFAPAWVDWRQGDDWIGWAPTAPVGAAFASPFVFVSARYLGSADVWTHVVYGANAASVYAETAPIPASFGFGGSYYSWGPTVAPQSNGSGGLIPIGQAWNTTRSGARITPVGFAPVVAPAVRLGAQSTLIPNEPIQTVSLPTRGPITAGSRVETEPYREPLGSGEVRVGPVPGPSPVATSRYRGPETVVIRSSVPDPEPHPARAFRSGDDGWSGNETRPAEYHAEAPAAGYAPSHSDYVAPSVERYEAPTATHYEAPAPAAVGYSAPAASAPAHASAPAGGGGYHPSTAHAGGGGRR